MKLIENATKEKLRGGFYTPEAIADFILKWAINGSTDSEILEPSCGDGVFLERIVANKAKYRNITAIELEKDEARKASQIKLPRTNVLNQDFYSFCLSTKKRFDLIVGNPPYIRYQYFNNEQKKLASEIFEKADLKYSKLTNAWVSFVVGSSLLLKRSGKLGLVLPAEILQVSYAATLRKFLSHFYNSVNIVSFRKLVFPHIQQEVVLLLCEKNGTNNHYIEHIEVEDIDALQQVDIYSLKRSKKKIDFKSNKWTFYFLDQDEIDFLERISNDISMPKISSYADVQVGITTGSNDFFSTPLSIVKKYNLHKFARPLVGRSIQISSLRFNKMDWERNREMEARAHLLVFPTMKELRPYPTVLQYISEGVKSGINKGYKTGIRDEWQIIPSVWVPDALFIRRNHLYPKLIINEVGAVTTDTMHRVTIKPGVNIQAFTASYYNSLSLAFAEISGRSHGGGVLELMPNEVEQIVLPYNEDNKNLLGEIDKMLRKKEPIENILEFTNREILEKGYGFTKKEIALATNIWKKLLNRRLKRGKKSVELSNCIPRPVNSNLPQQGAKVF